MTTPPQTNAQGQAQDAHGATEETFLKALDAEMAKVEVFTLQKVTELREKIGATEKNIQTSAGNNKQSKTDPLAKDMDQLMEQAEDIAEDFLRLEKFVNINFMG